MTEEEQINAFYKKLKEVNLPNATSPFNEEKGEFRMGKIRIGVYYKGGFYEDGSPEYKNLMQIEGKNSENDGTLLGYVSQLENEANKNSISEN
jgi:hypothetical protein